MADLYNNPLVWISVVVGIITVYVLLARRILLIGQWKGKVDEAQSTFKTTLDSFMKEIRADIKVILERMGPTTSTSGSPITLTDLGRKISARLDAGAIADSLVPKVHARVSGMQPYEVQEFRRDYIRGSEFVPTDDVKTLIMQCAFDNGLNQVQVLDVIAIELRDRLLSGQEE